MAAQRAGIAAHDEGVNAATAQAALGAIVDAPNLEEVDEGTPLIPVEKLKQYGVHASDIEKLKSVGFYTVEAVAYAKKSHVSDVHGISEQKAEEISEEPHTRVPMGFTTASEVHVKRGDLIAGPHARRRHRERVHHQGSTSRRRTCSTTWRRRAATARTASRSCCITPYVRKGKDENRMRKIYDSPRLPESECGFSSTPNGIEDAKE